LAKVNAEGRQVWHWHLPIGEHQLPPPVCSVSQAGRKSVAIITDNFYFMATLTNWRHHIACAVLVAADMPTVANVMNGVGCDRAGMGDVQAALDSQASIGNDGAGDGFLDSVFTLLNRKATELDLGVLLNRWQHQHEAGLPVTV
jgi:hypothetical protein